MMMMKTKKLNLMMMLAALACAACSDNDLPDNSDRPSGDKATVDFRMETERSASSAVTRSFGPEITKDGFRILAFKKNSEGNYVYAQDVPTEPMTFSGSTLSGRVDLPIGEYKFIPTYGAVPASAYAWPDIQSGTTLLADTLGFRHNQVDGHSVLFLESRPFNELPTYSVGLTATTTDPVYSVLKRAVARVDLLFIQVKKNSDGSYSEYTGTSDVFGGGLPYAIEMQFRNLNRTVNVAGESRKPGETFSLFDMNYKIEDMKKAVTKGNAAATRVGTDDFLDYDHVTPADIRKGSAHVQGAYVLPFPAEEFYTDVALVITQSSGDRRTIIVPGKLPLERNEVTLIRIYVVGDDGGGGDIFQSNVRFVVTIDTVWGDSNVVEG